MAPIPDTGRLEEFSLARLLIELYRTQFNGRVEFGRQRVECTFLFASGVAVGSEAPANKHGFCDQLVAAGTLTEAKRDRAVSVIESKGCKEVSALLELGFIEPRGVMVALRDQVQLRLTECFSWAKGSFTLNAGEAPPESANPFRVDVYAIVQAGIETQWRADQVLSELEPKISRFAHKTERFGKIVERLEPDEALAAFVEALDGEHSFWDALKLATTPRSLAAAWVLDAAGALEYKSESGTETEEARTDIELVFTDRPTSKAEGARNEADKKAVGSKKMESKDAEALRNEITSRFEKLNDLDHYELLNLNDQADTASIKSSYLQAAKRYHPDALAKAGLDEETRREANNVFARISKAYSVLSNPKQRAEYDAAQSLDGGQIDAERLANAESLFRKGEILLRAGNFAGAIEYLRPAVELWPDECDYCDALGWALYRKLPSEPALAKEHLVRAVELAPKNATALHHLSVVLRSLGEGDDADILLGRARAIDPNIA